MGVACCECPTYTTEGSLGLGGDGSGDCAGGGACFSGAGGGSSYTDPAATVITHTQGYQNGDGMIILTYEVAAIEASFELTICNEMVSPSGLYTWTETGIYMDTIETVSGCHSAITFDLTVNLATTSSQELTVCEEMVSPSGLYTWTETGVYMDTIDNAFGCDSVLTIDLTINTIDIGVTTITEIELMADLAGATYQWINCQDNSEIVGETNQSFIATADREYAVIVTDGAFTDTSDCYTPTNSSINENSTLNGVSISPNPFDQFFTLTFANQHANALIEIRDISGKLVFQAFANVQKEEVSFEGEAGIYFIVVTVDVEQRKEKIVKR
jgi:hypothetical protein